MVETKIRNQVETRDKGLEAKIDRLESYMKGHMHLSLNQLWLEIDKDRLTKELNEKKKNNLIHGGTVKVRGWGGSVKLFFYSFFFLFLIIIIVNKLAMEIQF